MTPQPLDGTLLAAFQRFADLSQYWHRKHTPDSLASQELEERHRLERDIPELIKRLTAFAAVGTSHLFDVAARVKADPPREDAGQGFRMLKVGERVQADDEVRGTRQWFPVTGMSVDVQVQPGFYGDFRRRIAKDTPKDTAGHIGADFEPEREETPVTTQETASKEAWRMRKALKLCRQWFAEDGMREDGVPIHDCDFATNPEVGTCDFHEMWGVIEDALTEYRLLKTGEVIQEHDECLWHNGEWRPVDICIGDIVPPCQSERGFRRRVTPPSPTKE